MSSSKLAHFRANRDQTITLPHTGLEVRVRKLGLTDLAAAGSIPNPLHAQVQALLNGQSAVDIERFPERAQVIDLVVRACMVDPPIADEPDECHLALSELPFADRLHIFTWAHEEATHYAPFPEPAGGSERPPRGRPRLRPASEPPAPGEPDRRSD